MKTNFGIKWAKIVAKSNEDMYFRQELLANPSKVMREHGIEIPNNIKLNLIEQQSVDEIYLVLPINGSDALNDDFLNEASAAGVDFSGLITTVEQT